MTINDIFKDNHKVIIIGPDRSKTEVCEAELHHLIMENKENVVVLIEGDANLREGKRDNNTQSSTLINVKAIV